MSELEEKLGNILNNPQMMQQVMQMAQTLNAAQGQASSEPAPPSSAQPSDSSGDFPDIDLSMLQKVASIAKNSAIDPHQQALLSALEPYVATPRIHKLERAMRAAKLAKIASSAIGNGALSFLTGR